jgi:hypothetical protein
LRIVQHQIPVAEAPVLSTMRFGKDTTNLCHEKLSSFLELPYDLQRRTCILTGLVRFCPVKLNDQGGDKAEYLQKCKERCLASTDPNPLNYFKI